MKSAICKKATNEQEFEDDESGHLRLTWSNYTLDQWADLSHSGWREEEHANTLIVLDNKNTLIGAMVGFWKVGMVNRKREKLLRWQLLKKKK